MKNFFSSFVPVFVATIVFPLVSGRGADSIAEMLTIYLFTPLIVASIAGGIMAFIKRDKKS